MTRGSLVLGPALLGVLLVAACSPADEIGVTPTPEPAVTGSEVASGPTVGTGSEGVVDTCRDPSPVVTGLVGSVNTIVASANADAFEVNTIPPVGPGTYALGPEGIPADGSITVLGPVSAQGPSG